MALVVDAEALAANYAAVAATTPSPLLAVVKGDAYGHGVATAVAAFARGGATRFVAGTLTEARLVLAAAAGARVLVLREPRDAGEVREAARLGADVAVGSVAALTRCVATLRALGAASRVHVEIDGGLGRGGLDWAAAEQALPEAAPYVAAVFAQWPSGAGPEVTARLAGLGQRHGCAVHVGGTNALLAEVAADVGVRVGRGLYGVWPSGAPGPGLRPALRWTARAQPVRSATAGYASMPAHPEAVLLDVGYADGLPAGGGWPVLVGGRRYVTRHVFMGSSLAVPAEPGPPAGDGDEALLLGAGADGQGIGVRDVAGCLGVPTSAVLVAPRGPRTVLPAS